MSNKNDKGTSNANLADTECIKDSTGNLANPNALPQREDDWRNVTSLERKGKEDSEKHEKMMRKIKEKIVQDQNGNQKISEAEVMRKLRSENEAKPETERNSPFGVGKYKKGTSDSNS